MSDLELTLPARAENVAVIRHAFRGLGAALGLEDDALSDLRLAVTEACTNVVVHAYPDGDGDLRIRATLSEGGRIVVSVLDDGLGMGAVHDSPGLGLGLPLIASLSERVEFDSPDGATTEVRMTFRTDGLPG